MHSASKCIVKIDKLLQYLSYKIKNINALMMNKANEMLTAIVLDRGSMEELTGGFKRSKVTGSIRPIDFR